MYFSNSEFLRERDSSLLVDFDYDQNLFEYEQNSASPLLKGRLKTKLKYWHTSGASNFVIDTIKFGYRILFISTPCRALFHNNKSALENASFVESAISELVGNHSVIEVLFVPHVVNPLSVPYQAPFLLSFSDASNVACGAYLVALRKFPTACGALLRQKRALHGENLKLCILL